METDNLLVEVDYILEWELVAVDNMVVEAVSNMDLVEHMVAVEEVDNMVVVEEGNDFLPKSML
ncbi:hypothetical protein M9Y10_010969 [Tritrichomonas musculus]|uniref:Uncharacterized protein n=1 Tax=Tritrichomonas musculus TaxID=1915356 RepID=A0ABR2IM52_9EUKA